MAVIALYSVAALLLAGSVLIAARRALQDDPEDTADPYGLSHAHGLGLNPADRSLMVATHNGLFRVAADGDAVERVGDSLQDTMGFTVVGPDRFLGSGHPDLAGLRSGLPDHLGLIESSDAGRTWTEVSLGGEADLHALVVADGQVFAWDAASGRFIVSNDRRSWTTRSTLEISAFAVDPADSDHIVAVGPTELLESSDGGASWQPQVGPVVTTLSWSSAGVLWGIEADGTVQRFDDSAWNEAGRVPGEPEALLATDDTLYAAVADATGRTGIYVSSDQGATWSRRYQDPAPGGSIEVSG